ncbi:GMC oxidoreductase [Luteibacter aegosomatissinici]|uniref:GMC oxidoreductase n=1 Tax=Luteibacter aegosomatissinici TaxID=2911539 RepID=UPI001FF83421|nr:GMC family oxidoreductase [Luteibacter aegosomatissinici]UPG96439.1 GMC family oxidoreductase [Luteibacter aegosomatissinici]
MILDYLDGSAPADYKADLCVIGAGPAGIAIARAFLGTSVRVCLVESGGLAGEDRSQALCEGTADGGAAFDMAHSRMRVFGGSCTLWGGGCIPLADTDLEPRDWVPESGWPLRYADLAPWYAKAREFCQIDAEHTFGPGQFDGPTQRKPLDLDPEALVNLLFARSPILFGDAYRDEIRAAPNITVVLHANLMELEANASGTSVVRARLGALTGRRGYVRARHFVLAAGGIENARLLLLSDSVAPCGLGNDRDLVGRYFMDHPRGTIGNVHSTTPDRLTRPYERTIGKVRLPVSPEIGLAHAAQRRHRVLNGRVHPFAVEGAVPQGIRALRNVRAALRPPTRNEATLLEARLSAAMANGPTAAAVAVPPNLALSAVSLGLHIGDVLRAVAKKVADKPTVHSERVELVGFFEQAPNRDSRVTLGQSRDALGLRRVNIDWRLTELDRYTYRTLTSLAGEPLAHACGGTFEAAPWAVDESVKPDVFGTAHHMGTTRMSTDPTTGVVDTDGTVHGVHNLHVAGSSVFPTSGWAFPTFTIVALSLRLAEHLRVLLAACEGSGMT